MRKLIAIAVFCFGCAGVRPVTVAPPSWSGLLAGQTVYNRLTHDQAEIIKAHKGKDRTAAYQAFKATESAWEIYSGAPTVDHWNNLQSVGSNLDSALRKMRGQQVGAPGQMPLCVTMKESWCKQPRVEGERPVRPHGDIYNPHVPNVAE